ncbi:PLP-dependent aminotransferase family protein [uncultured Paraglaciecola sp.]|uniref:aminotransferase-like domain-containing protein n=1 Tax=uncultured Paraglaciecola sp. TaxID=1765024 RepID=UPI0025979018|nr:PLP-dependent aminotransferase family protein [uncultured Paraglaciecola sp.]
MTYVNNAFCILLEYIKIEFMLWYRYHNLLFAVFDAMKPPKYIEISNIIEKRIDLGQYAKGSKLPTHRALAQELDTTAVTVSKAYQTLATAGKIESFVGRGSFVFDDKPLSQVIRSGDADNEFNLSILQPCMSHNVKRLHHEFQNSFNQDFDARLFEYAEDSGLLKHRDIGRHWAVKYGLDMPKVEQLHLTNGAQHGLSTLIQLYTQADDLIAVEAQTYPGILSIANFLGRRVVGIQMDESGMCPNDLARQFKQEKPALVIVIPSHQNPTAITMPTLRRKQIAATVLKYNAWLIEDDIYGFLNETPLPAISNFAPENTFHISSLSKAVSPGIRCGFLNSPLSEAKKIAAFLRAMVWLPSPLLFETASNLIESGTAFKLADQQKAIAIKRQKIAQKVLNQFELNAQVTSYHLWLTLPGQWNADSFCLAAKNQGLLVSSSTYFCADGKPIDKVRLSVMAIDSEPRFSLALKNLAQLLDTSPMQHSQF